MDKIENGDTKADDSKRKSEAEATSKPSPKSKKEKESKGMFTVVQVRPILPTFNSSEQYNLTWYCSNPPIALPCWSLSAST